MSLGFTDGGAVMLHRVVGADAGVPSFHELFGKGYLRPARDRHRISTFAEFASLGRNISFLFIGSVPCHELLQGIRCNSIGNNRSMDPGIAVCDLPAPIQDRQQRREESFAEAL